MINETPIYLIFEVMRNFRVEVLYCFGLLKQQQRMLYQNHNKFEVSAQKVLTQLIYCCAIMMCVRIIFRIINNCYLCMKWHNKVDAILN